MDKWLRSQGFTVIRFWNNDVEENLDGVIRKIMNLCLDAPSPLSPPVEGGGGSA